MSTILSGVERQRSARTGISMDLAWRPIAWFGFFLTVIGIGQLVLYLYPSLGFGSPEWEYGASAQMLGSLPLPTVGLAALFAAAAGSESKRGLIALSVLLMLLALSVLSILGLFWTVVPMAIRGTPAAAADPVYQTIARTTLSGVGFGVLYLWAAVLAVRQVKRFSRR